MFSFFLGTLLIVLTTVNNSNLFFASVMLISWMFVLMGFMQIYNIDLVVLLVGILFLGGLMVFFCFSIMLTQKQNYLLNKLWLSKFVMVLFTLSALSISNEITQSHMLISFTSIFDLSSYLLVVCVSLFILFSLVISVMLCSQSN